MNLESFVTQHLPIYAASVIQRSLIWTNTQMKTETLFKLYRAEASFKLIIDTIFRKNVGNHNTHHNPLPKRLRPLFVFHGLRSGVRRFFFYLSLDLSQDMVARALVAAIDAFSAVTLF